MVGRPSGMGKTLDISSSAHFLFCMLTGQVFRGGGGIPVLVCAHMRRISSLGDNSRLWPHRTIGIQLVAAVRLIIVFALFAVEA